MVPTYYPHYYLVIAITPHPLFVSCLSQNLGWSKRVVVVCGVVPSVRGGVSLYPHVVVFVPSTTVCVCMSVCRYDV
jgi:hypothetical protein